MTLPGPVPNSLMSMVARTGARHTGPDFCLSRTGPGHPGPLLAKPGPVTAHQLPCVRVHVPVADLPDERRRCSAPCQSR